MATNSHSTALQYQALSLWVQGEEVVGFGYWLLLVSLAAVATRYVQVPLSKEVICRVKISVNRMSKWPLTFTQLQAHFSRFIRSWGGAVLVAVSILSFIPESQRQTLSEEILSSKGPAATVRSRAISDHQYEDPRSRLIISLKSLSEEILILSSKGPAVIARRAGRE